MRNVALFTINRGGAGRGLIGGPDKAHVSSFCQEFGQVGGNQGANRAVTPKSVHDQTAVGFDESQQHW